MKKSIMKVLYICSMFFLFNSCEQENDITTTETPKDGIAKFHATISKTRTTGDLWDEGDAIGIYALKGGTTLPNGVFDEKSNIKYVTEAGDGHFKPASTEIMLPSTGTYDFVAYYPYQSDMTNNIYQIDISNQAKQGDIDLLYSDNAKGHTYDKPNAKLDFNHMLSMITLNITAEDDVTSLENATVEIRNTSTMGTFNLSSKEISITKDSKATITPNINCTKEKATVSAILLPGQEFSEATVVITIAGKDLEWTPQEKVLESGKNYMYNIKITTQGTLDAGSAIIKDWDNIEIEEDIDFIVKPGDENNNGGGDDGDGDGNEGEGGEEPEVNPDPEPTAELLFPGADFEYANTNQFKAASIRNHQIAVLATTKRLSEGKEIDTKALNIAGANLAEQYVYIAKVEENKIQGHHTKLSFYIKGIAPQGIIVNLLYATDKEGKEENEVFYTINDENIKTLVNQSTSPSYGGKINTNDKWIKATLDITDLPSETENKRNGFGVKIPIDGTTLFDIYIDNITIE